MAKEHCFQEQSTAGSMASTRRPCSRDAPQRRRAGGWAREGRGGHEFKAGKGEPHSELGGNQDIGRVRRSVTSQSTGRTAKVLVVAALFFCAAHRAAGTVNEQCALGSNCTAGAALVCMNPVPGDFSYPYVRDGGGSICRCANSSFAGPNCDQPCPGGHTAPCSLKGECKYDDATCSCENGRTGAMCELTCPKAGGAVCGGKGSCSAMDGVAVCTCLDGWRGAECTIECQGGAARPCRGRGTCELDGSCTCQGGWRGADCSLECPGSNLFPCNLHGKCTAEATCECTATYRGYSCEFECPTVNDIPCGGRGLCNASGICNCNKGFRGRDCMLECAGGVQNPCNGHGKCMPDAKCECSQGWAGQGCTEVCPGGIDNPCSGHGNCSFAPQGAFCDCWQGDGTGVLARYSGDDCSIPVYNPRKEVEESAGNATAFRDRIVQKTEVAFSVIPPLAVFVAIVAVILARLYTQVTQAKLEEIEAINKQISHLSRPVQD